MTTKHQLWELKISCWAGMSMFAEHYYAEMNVYGWSRRQVRVEHMLTAKEAEVLVKKDRWASWKEGMETNRFDTREEALEAAKVAWDFVSADEDALAIDDLSSTAEILAGPVAFVSVGHKLRLEIEAVAEDDHGEFMRLLKRWHALLDEFGYEEDTNKHTYHWDDPNETSRIIVARADNPSGWEVVEEDWR